MARSAQCLLAKADIIMEKPEHSMHEEKSPDEARTSSRDFDLGAIINAQFTPEEERKVLWKLDLL